MSVTRARSDWWLFYLDISAESMWGTHITRPGQIPGLMVPWDNNFLRQPRLAFYFLFIARTKTELYLITVWIKNKLWSFRMISNLDLSIIYPVLTSSNKRINWHQGVEGHKHQRSGVTGIGCVRTWLTLCRRRTVTWNNFGGKLWNLALLTLPENRRTFLPIHSCCGDVWGETADGETSKYPR